MSDSDKSDQNKPKGNGWGANHSSEDESDLIYFEQFANRRGTKDKPPKPPKEPMINLPPVTKALAGILLVLFAIHEYLLPASAHYWALTQLGFVPARLNGDMPFSIWTILSPISYMFLHGGLMHIAMNSVMLLAFGAGLEKWMGGRRLLVFFTGCGIAALLPHLALNWGSTAPVIGASGALSGFFAAILIMLKNRQQAAGQQANLFPFIALWVIITIGFGIFGGSEESAIAWEAHLGGFLAGFVLLKPVWRYF